MPKVTHDQADLLLAVGFDPIELINHRVFKAPIVHIDVQPNNDGVYDAESMYGTTEEVWFDEWEHGGPPWKNPDVYRKNSPSAYAGNFHTPNLIIHSGLDFRVPLGQGLELFTALQRQGVPSKFLYFPDEGHLVLKPGNSKLWHETVFEWLSEYLKKGAER